MAHVDLPLSAARSLIDHLRTGDPPTAAAIDDGLAVVACGARLRLIDRDREQQARFENDPDLAPFVLACAEIHQLVRGDSSPVSGSISAMVAISVISVATLAALEWIHAAVADAPA